VIDASDTAMVLNTELIASRKLSRGEVEQVAGDVLLLEPHVFRVYRRGQLLNGGIGSDPVDERMRNGYNETRSPDLFVLADPYWVAGLPGGTNHGTPFSYDTHVPVIFLGAQIKPGKYNFTIMPNDIAPTLATLLEIETPSGSIGRALHEIIR